VDAKGVRSVLGAAVRKALRQLMCGMRRNQTGWNRHQLNAMR
jgi:hypothetical protein